jgi:hypothetical protein
LELRMDLSVTPVLFALAWLEQVDTVTIDAGAE